MSVDTAEIRRHCCTAAPGKYPTCDLSRAAADELDELRELRGAIVRVVREHEATKRELEDTKALLARGVELFAPLEERLQAAETALREYTGLDTKHAHIAQDYFARYGERKEGGHG